jgi:hypothetical protein
MYNRSINQNAGASTVSLQPAITQPSSRPQAQIVFTGLPKKFKDLNPNDDTELKENVVNICSILQKMPLTENNQQITIPNYQQKPGDKIIADEVIGSRLIEVSNLYGLVVLILYVFNMHATNLSTFDDSNETNVNTIANPLLYYINQASSTKDNIKQIYNVLMSFYNFTKYGFQELSVKNVVTLEKYLKELIKSDYQLKYFHDQYIQGKSPELVGKWQNLINQLTKLQLLIFIKKNKEGDDNMIDNLLTALNGKMKIVNNILAQNVSDGDAAPFEDDDDVASPSAPIDLAALRTELAALQALSPTDLNLQVNIDKIKSIIDMAAREFSVQLGGSSIGTPLSEDVKKIIIQAANVDTITRQNTIALKKHVQLIIAPKILNKQKLDEEESKLYEKYRIFKGQLLKEKDINLQRVYKLINKESLTQDEETELSKLIIASRGTKVKFEDYKQLINYQKQIENNSITKENKIIYLELKKNIDKAIDDEIFDDIYLLDKKEKIDKIAKSTKNRAATKLQQKFKRGRGPQRIQLIKILQELKSIIAKISDDGKRTTLLQFFYKLPSPKTIVVEEGRKNDETADAGQEGGSLSSILGSKYYGKYLKYKSKYLELSI